MKKIIIFNLLIIAAVSFSCRKERTCECRETVTTTFGSNSSKSTTNYKYTKEKQRVRDINDYGFRGTEPCQSWTSTQTFTTGSTKTTEVECELGE